ncbi:LysR family transcriptional regulator [Sphingobium sp. AN558]|uniref:LysR substrate-binding domain-containing protein n=1 Tax=Sphingobium sp. AN558 TaxID=3133442 RepID=UPI0030C5A952
MASPSLRQFDIFAQMVASGSIMDCARMLGLSAEEVERDITSLEMRLGYRLFDRTVAPARLTPAGRKTAQVMALLSQGDAESFARDAATIESAIPDPLPAAKAPSHGRQMITLAAPAPVFGHFQDALAAFEEANEDIAIALDLNVQFAEDAAAALSGGRVDIAYFYALVAPAAFPSRYGWSEQLNLYVGEEHPLVRYATVSRDDLMATSMLAMDRHNGLRHVIDDALAGGRIILGRAVLETDNMFDIIAGLRDGLGCFAAFGPMARDLGRMSGIRRLALDAPLPAIEVRQAVNESAAGKAGVQALADYLFL